MKVNRRNYDALGESLAPYSQAVVHNDIIYTSGLTAYGSQAQGKRIDLQADQIFSNLQSICLAHNTSLKNIIKVTLFVSDLTDIELLRSALFKVYGKDLPASSLIRVDALFSTDLNIEIEAMIAV